AYVELSGADFGFISGNGKLAFELKNGSFGAAIAGLADISAEEVFVQYTNATTTIGAGETIRVGTVSYTFEAGIAADTVAFAVQGLSTQVLGFVYLAGDVGFRMSGSEI